MCFFLGTLSITFAEAQQINYVTYTDSDVTNSKRYKKGNDYQKDFLLFMDMLEKTHPAFAMTDPPIDIKKTREEGYKLTKDIDNPQKFGLYLQSIISVLGDGHTYIMNNFKNDVLFPMNFSCFDGDFYITLICDKHKDFLGKKILKINGYDIYDVIMSFASFMSCENDVGLIRWVHGVASDMWKENPYNINDSTLTVTCDDGSSLSLHPMLRKEINCAQVDKEAMHSPFKKTKLPFRYEIYPEKGICYLQFSSCIDKNTLRFQYYVGNTNGLSEDEYEEKIKDIPQFDTFLQEVFDTIQKQGIKTLVVDVRDNGGGNSLLCDQLLSWLKPADEIKCISSKIRSSNLLEEHYPEIVKILKERVESAGEKFEYGKIYEGVDFSSLTDSTTKEKLDNLFVTNKDNDKIFKGNVVFIQDDGTYSSAGDLIVTALDNKIGTIIGEESSYRPCNFGDILGFELPNTNVKGGVSHAYFMRPDTDACDEKSLIPNIHIQRTWSDYIEGRDACWQWIIENY